MISCCCNNRIAIPEDLGKAKFAGYDIQSGEAPIEIEIKEIDKSKFTETEDEIIKVVKNDEDSKSLEHEIASEITMQELSEKSESARKKKDTLVKLIRAMRNHRKKNIKKSHREAFTKEKIDPISNKIHEVNEELAQLEAMKFSIKNSGNLLP